MTHRAVFGLLALTAIAFATQGTPAPAQAAQPPRSRYIVVLVPGTAPGEFAASTGIPRGRTYTRVFNGLAADLTSAESRRVRSDPRVLGITPARLMRALDVHTAPASVADPGLSASVNRIDAEFAPIIETVGIAVIDSGLDLGRPEFNARGVLNFVASAASGQDDFGHGTHVAGIAAANAMPFGFRGVAPRAPLWSLKVLDANGVGDDSDVVAAIDWLTANGPGLGIRIANMSFGGSGFDSGNCGVSGSTVVDALHYAICQSVEAGIIYVAAAGNGASDAAGLVPAAYPEVVAVSNVRDNDGRGGAMTPPMDDRFNPGSDFGSAVDIAAPGTAVISTVPTGTCLLCDPSGYRALTGTSMAAPHVTGAIAQYVRSNPGVSTIGASGSLAPAAAGVLALGQAQSSFCGFVGDPDTTPEPMLYVGIPDSDCGATATPDGDADGLPDMVEVSTYGTDPTLADSDGDGCADGKEVGGEEIRGGRRDPLSSYDFFDVPAPAGPGVGADGKLLIGSTATRNRVVTLQDVATIIAYVGRMSSNVAYSSDGNADGIADGAQLDRLPSQTPGMLWRSGAPNGAVTLQDAAAALVQVGTNCS